MALNQVLKKYNLNWQDTGWVSLDQDEVPALGSSVASKALYELNPQKPLLNRWIRDGNFKYILKFKEEKQISVNDTTKGISPSVMTGMGGMGKLSGGGTEDMLGGRGSDVMGQWMQNMEKQATIERNMDYIMRR